MYEELLSYVKSDNETLRSHAVAIVLSLTANNLDPDLETRLDEFLRVLWRLASRPKDASCKDALSALVNLADQHAARLSTPSWIGSICEELEERHVIGPVELEKLLYMLLANVTREAAAVDALLTHEVFIWRIFGHFAESGAASVPIETREAGNYICNVFVNITGTPRGREWFAQMDASCWDVLLDQCKWPERLLPVLSVLKNLACDLSLVDGAKPILDIRNLLLLLSRLVFPRRGLRESLAAARGVVVREVPLEIESRACGPLEEESARKVIVESITSLLRVAVCRKVGRELALYEVLQAWHTLEGNVQIMEAIENIVHLVHYSEEELAEHDGN